MVTFGQAIAKARHQKGWTLDALAGYVDLSKQFLSDLEHDRRSPSDATVYRLALALELHDDVLHFRLGSLPPDLRQVDADDQAIQSALSKLRERLRGYGS